jgi:hypothetical protein
MNLSHIDTTGYWGLLRRFPKNQKIFRRAVRGTALALSLIPCSLSFAGKGFSFCNEQGTRPCLARKFFFLTFVLKGSVSILADNKSGRDVLLLDCV